MMDHTSQSTYKWATVMQTTTNTIFASFLKIKNQTKSSSTPDLEELEMPENKLSRTSTTNWQESKIMTKLNTKRLVLVKGTESLIWI
jgi:hypothetical protein